MNADCRRFVLEQTIASAILNAALNGLGAWQLFASLGMDSVPMFGKLSVFGDVFATAFLLPFLVCFSLTTIAHASMFRGLSRLDTAAVPQAWAFAMLPAGPAARSAVLGLICTMLLVPAVIGALLVLGVAQVELVTFCIAKALSCAALASAITYLAAVRALTDTPAFSPALPG